MPNRASTERSGTVCSVSACFINFWSASSRSQGFCFAWRISARPPPWWIRSELRPGGWSGVGQGARRRTGVSSGPSSVSELPHSIRRFLFRYSRHSRFFLRRLEI